MDGFLDDRIRPATKGLACAVLRTRTEISTGNVALYVDVVDEYTPGMVQSGVACVVRQLWGGTKLLARRVIYGLTGQPPRDTKAGTPRTNPGWGGQLIGIRLLHNTTQLHHFIPNVPNESLSSTGIDSSTPTLFSVPYQLFIRTFPYPRCLLWTHNCGPCRCPLAKHDLTKP